LELSQVITPKVKEQIEAAIDKVGSTQALTPIKLLLPDTVDYGMIRCVIASAQTHKADWQSVAPRLEDIESFLAKPHPRPLAGPWRCGWSLGFHSHFAGSEWTRSGIGELAFRLKYQGDLSTLPSLVEQALALVTEQPDLIRVDAVLPVPPSKVRETDPVQAFCGALSDKIKIPMQTTLAKTRQTQAQKELKTLAQKRANVAGAFTIKGNITGKRVLVVDDLFDSGATLEEVARLLLKKGAACVNILTLTRAIHADL
ncbi:MAG: hypothetical protein FJZ96_13675, partial [Chloroflexi bacterium]|nr:hypothetical protein [Chloroflexota bacterium]